MSGNLTHQSGVNQHGAPFVQLILDGKVIGQFDVTEARDHARAMLEAAEAAEQDAFIVFYAKTRIGASPESAVKLLQDFRQFREITTAKRGGPHDPADWIRP